MRAPESDDAEPDDPEPGHPERTHPEAPSSVLAAEQAYLDSAREQLHHMRQRTLALDAAGGNAVSTEYLAAALHRRAATLVDDPDVPLFFGRTDTASNRWYIGRRHVHDDAGDPVVVDWRAQVSTGFYRATPTQPMGLRLRRRFGFEGGQLTAYEDEHLADGREPTGRSTILAAEIERPRTGPMRDIVATVQPEQDVVVRTDLDQTVCVQGAPGTGKTAVGLHRAAYLLYAFRDRLAHSGVLVVGPNRAFLSYIAQVLPALGEFDVRQTTAEELLGHVPVRRAERPEVATLKGDPRMALVLHRAVWSHLREPGEALVVPRGSRRWRVPAYALAELTAQLRERGVRYGAGRALLAQRLAAAVLAQMEAAGESPDDRVRDGIARCGPVRACVDALWPRVDPVRLVLRLLGDADALAAAAAGLLEPQEQALLRWAAPARGPGSAPWSAADTVLIDEVADLVERQPSLGHVILDEAQDLSAMQLRAIGRRCSTGSATVLGDLAQGTTPWAVTSWGQALSHLGKPDASIDVLDRGYRVPAAVVDYAARLLPTIAPGLPAPVPVREHRGRLDVVATSDPVAAVAAQLTPEREGTTGVIAADARVPALAADLRRRRVELPTLGTSGPAASRCVLVPATLAKGLEFDSVVVVEPAEIVEAEPRGLRRLYVVLTRAVSGLAVVHARPLPAPLAAA